MIEKKEPVMADDERTAQLGSTQLGSTTLQVSRVGIGSWAVGGADWVSSWGPQDDDESIAAIRHAVDGGVNWIDTAAVYGFGHAEEVVARAVEGYSDADRPHVFSKGGLVWNPDDRRAPSKRIGRADSIRRGVEDSLRRLGTERIDLYFLHWPADDVPVEDVWTTLVALRDEGKLAAIGLSNHTVDAVERAEQIGHVNAVQPLFSAIAPAVADDLLPWCAEHGTGVVVYSPMGSGLLTGRFSAERVAALPSDDWRSRSAAFTTDLPKNLAVASAMARVADRYGVPTPAVAVAWTLGFPGVTGAIVGGRSTAQVDDWLGAGDLHLTAEDYADIGAAEPSRRD